MTFASPIQLFLRIASEADKLLSDLQSSLHKQEERLTAYARQQHEVSLGLILDRLSLCYSDMNLREGPEFYNLCCNRHMPEQWILHDQSLK